MSYILYQNWPNPFNSSTSISYFLQRIANVCLKVYDLSGREVTMLVTGSQTSGLHHVNWDGTDGSGRPVSSGVYIYRLQAGAFKASQRMILLR